MGAKQVKTRQGTFQFFTARKKSNRNHGQFALNGD